MNDAVVLRGMLDKGTYQKYGPSLRKLKGMEKEHKTVLSTIGRYWKKYPDVEVMTPEELRVFLTQTNPTLKDKEFVDLLLDNISRAEIANQDLMLDELHNLIEHQYIGNIYTMCVAKMEEQESSVMAKVKEEVDRFYEQTGKLAVEDNVLGDISLDELLHQQKGEFQWRLPWLNYHLGFPPPGTLGHIYATPDTGKTTLAISEAAWIASQMQETDDCVLFLGNEEAIARTYLRAFCSLAGVSKEWLENPDNREEAMNRYTRFTEKIKPHLVCVDAVSDIVTVEENVKKFTPKVVFIDQGPKVHYPGDHSGVDKLKYLYNWYRETAKKYLVVLITLGQADAKAENKRRLTLQNIDGSKVGIPGELDWALGISRTDDEGMEWVRYLTLAKNKLTGSLDNYRGYLERLKAQYR